MADCVSLPNAAELVEQLRSNPNNVWMTEAAGSIEQLLADNAKLKAERDAAINDIPRFCDKCKHLNQTYCAGCEWEWRGVHHD